VRRRRSVFPKYVHAYRDRHGTLRADFRWRSIHQPLPLPPLSEEWWASYRATLADTIAGREPGARSEIGASRTKPGTVAAAFVTYVGSASFKLDLARNTQRGHLSVLRQWRDQWGEHRIGHLQRRHVVAWVAEKADTPAMAKIFLRALRRMMQYCISLGLIEIDPTTGVQAPRLRSTGIHSWSEEEIEQYRRYHPLGSTARTALELLLGTGQRRSDVVRMGRQHLHDGMIRVSQQKTGWSGDIPISLELAQALDAVPPSNMIFLVNASGSPYTAAGFGNLFRGWCDQAGLPKACSAHGLRKAACRRLAEAGCTVHEIAAISGHLSLVEVQRYTKAVDQTRLAQAAMVKAGTKIGEPEIRFAKITP
jgi:site-specific recombinase XerD